MVRMRNKGQKLEYIRVHHPDHFVHSHSRERLPFLLTFPPDESL